MDDVNRLTNRDDSWCITLLAASGALEPEYPTQFHFCYGGKKGDESYNSNTLLIHDIEGFDDLYNDLRGQLKSEFGFDTDRQRFHDSSNPKIYIRHLENKERINAFMVRIAWSAMCWDTRRILIAKMLSDCFAEHYTGGIKPYSDELTIKGIGYSDYSD